MPYSTVDRSAAFDGRLPIAVVPERVAARAAASPEATAIGGPGSGLTYAELIRRADRVARYLLAGRAAPGDLVGVCLDRDASAVVALLGVLRAGCAYLPLDPDYPAARLRFMLEDSGATAVVTTPRRLAGLPAGQARIVDLAAAQAEPGESGPGESGDLPAIAASDLAYVIYTSGSTGTPKGVAVEHGNLARLFDAVQDRIPVSPSDVWTWFHSVAFDFSVWEIWGALASGGRLVVTSSEQARDPGAFLALLRQSQATILSQTPSAFGGLLALIGDDQPSWSVRAVVLGGEAVSVTGLAGVLGAAPGTWPRLYNLYGITETTVHATVKELTAPDLAAGVRSPIGTPLGDLRAAVLDQDRRPVPPGAEGELWIGGAGVARGYVGRPELTAERFVAGERPGDGEGPGDGAMRWYRSGDLVRQLASGELEYIGRIDRQVKVRGFRIELGEIESALTAHPAVSAAVVEPREGPSQADRQLDAYLVGPDPDQPTLDEIRDWLAGRLPDYMIPSAFLRVGALPLTPNGKVDREALRRLSGRPLPRRGDADEPQTEAESALRAIWSDLLGVRAIRGDDNFFTVGGDSMLALRLIAACKSAGIGLTMRDIFTHPTLAGLAAAVGGPTAPAGPARPAPAPAAPRPPEHADLLIPANQMQCGVLFEAERHAHARAYQVVSAVQVTSSAVLSRDDVQAALERLATDNIALRTSFDLVHYPSPMQVVHARPSVQLSYQDLTGASPQDQDKQIRYTFGEEGARRFGRGDYPLWRVACAQTGPQTVEIMFAHHHAILDGWSVARFFDQLAAALNGRRYETAPPWIHQEAARLEADAVGSERDREFWRSAARSAEPLPLPRRAIQPDQVEPVTATAGIDHGLRALIRQTAARWGCSPKHLHLAAHLRAIARYAGWEDHAATGLIVNARPEEPRAEHALGMFLNLVPLSVDHFGSSWRELAGLVQAAEGRMLPHRWFPFAKMVSELGMAPINVWFNYTDFSTTAMGGFLEHVTEVSATSMPLTVAVVDDGLILETSTAYLSAEQCAELAQAHQRNVADAAGK